MPNLKVFGSQLRRRLNYTFRYLQERDWTVRRIYCKHFCKHFSRTCSCSQSDLESQGIL